MQPAIRQTLLLLALGLFLIVAGFGLIMMTLSGMIVDLNLIVAAVSGIMAVLGFFVFIGGLLRFALRPRSFQGSHQTKRIPLITL